jgi:hypothetical protein
MPDLEDRVAALERVFPDQVLDLIYHDTHQWSERPCPTCQSITRIVGRPFGCVRFAAERAKARQPKL